MAEDYFLLFIAGSILFLSALVWLMHKEGSSDAWGQISINAKEERNKNEKQS